MNSKCNIASQKNRKKESKNRRAKGDGGLRQLDNGNWEGIEKIRKKSGKILPKSVTRKNKQEVLLIKKQLKALEPLDDDVVKINVDKLTNEITLIRKSVLESSKKKHIDNQITVNDYVDYWLWNYRRKGQKGKMVKDTTFEDYVQKCQHIKNKLGNITDEKGNIIEVKVIDLTFEFMEKAMLDLHSEVKETTAIQVRNHLYNMMKFAKKDGVITINPFQDEEINFPDSGEKIEKKVIKEDDIDKVIQYCLRLWYIDVVTQLMTGGRVSEIRGLTWVDILEKECEVKFSHNYNSVKQFIFDENNHIVSQGRKRRYSSLKSSSSYRNIKVPQEFMKILMIHKALQKNLAQRLGKIFKETDPVFTTSTYTPLGRNDTNDRVKKVVKDLQIENWEEITSHCLRHGFCYAGLLNDVPLEYMQILLGHSDISVTRKWYAHFDKSKVNAYATKVNTKRTDILQKINQGCWIPNLCKTN